MSRMICLETEEGEVFVNLDGICQASVAPDTVHVQFAGGQSHTYSGNAAHALIQALRHEERRTSQQR